MCNWHSCDRCGMGIEAKLYRVYLSIQSEPYSKVIEHNVYLCEECKKEALGSIVAEMENLSKERI